MGSRQVPVAARRFAGSGKHARPWQLRARRLFRVGAANVAIAGVLLASGGLLFGFAARSQKNYGSALSASRLSVVFEHLHRTESTLDGGVQPPGAHDRIQRDLAEANGLIDRLTADRVVARSMVPQFDRYRGALDLEFNLLLMGDTKAAARVDSALVDPGVNQLAAELERAVALAVARADSASNQLRTSAAIVLVTAGGIIAIIVGRSRRHAVRSAASAERAQVVAASERRFRALVNGGDDVIIVTDRDGVIQEMSDSVVHVLGVEPGPRLGRRAIDLVHPDETTAAAVEFARALATGSAGPSAWRCRDGNRAWRNVEVTWTNMLDVPEVAGVVLNLRDVTERHRLEEELRHRAFHDSLTGLANRALLRDRIGHAMTNRDTCPAALMIIDLDGFKHLNDSLGHPAGDHALAVVAERLLGVSRPRDTVARLGGDEFAILVEDAPSIEEIQALGRRLVDAVAQPFEWDGHAVVLGASVGVAFAEGGVHSADDLIRNADVGLYAAKQSGRGTVRTFDANLFDAARARYELETDLRTAVDNHELVLQYQAIVELETTRPTGFEALVRWQHPGRGMLSPDQFIPIAEETGVIVPLGRWVLTRACRDLASWTRAHPTAGALYVSVNLSACQLEDANIVADVRDALEQSALEPARLVLEITETALMHDLPSALVRLRELKDLGIRLSVDDFGTGYSSLSYLRQFPIDTVKIDKSFVDNLASEGEDAAFVGAILRLSEALNLDTLAEGIETEDQADTLRRLGCHLGQGFHYARPVGAADVEALLDRETTTTATTRTSRDSAVPARAGV